MDKIKSLIKNVRVRVALFKQNLAPRFSEARRDVMLYALFFIIAAMFLAHAGLGQIIASLICLVLVVGFFLILATRKKVLNTIIKKVIELVDSYVDEKALSEGPFDNPEYLPEITVRRSEQKGEYRWNLDGAGICLSVHKFTNLTEDEKKTDTDADKPVIFATTITISNPLIFDENGNEHTIRQRSVLNYDGNVWAMRAFLEDE